jgi:hypothetical protein
LPPANAVRHFDPLTVAPVFVIGAMSFPYAGGN